MEAKKSPKADLRNKRTLFFEIGLLISLAICFWAFEWASPDVTVKNMNKAEVEIEPELEIPVTEIEPPEPEPLPPPEPKVIEIFEVIDDSKKVEDIDWDGSEDSEKKAVSPIIKLPAFIPEPEPVDPIKWELVEDKPEFPGGDAGILKFIKDNTVYPPKAKEVEMQGRVYIKFVIDKKGRVTDAEVVNSIDPYLDAEALRVIRLMPDWTPGKQRGKAVAVSYIIPFNFKLS